MYLRNLGLPKITTIFSYSRSFLALLKRFFICVCGLFAIKLYIWSVVWIKVQLCIWIFNYSSTVEKTNLSTLNCLCTIVKINCTYRCGPTSRLSILFHRSVCLSLHKYHTIPVTIIYSKSWNQIILVLQLCFSFSVLFSSIDTKTLSTAVWISESVSQFLQKKKKAYWDFD